MCLPRQNFMTLSWNKMLETRYLPRNKIRRTVTSVYPWSSAKHSIRYVFCSLSSLWTGWSLYVGNRSTVQIVRRLFGAQERGWWINACVVSCCPCTAAVVLNIGLCALYPCVHFKFDLWHMRDVDCTLFLSAPSLFQFATHPRWFLCWLNPFKSS